MAGVRRGANSRRCAIRSAHRGESQLIVGNLHCNSEQDSTFHKCWQMVGQFPLEHPRVWLEDASVGEPGRKKVEPGGPTSE